MASSPMTFDGITRDKFQAIRARLRAQAHVEVVGDTGTATADGFTVTWTYTEAAQTLVIQCVKKPWLVPESMIESHIQDLVNGL